MGKRFACHKISEGAAQAEAIISKDRIMFYQVRPEDGVMTEKDHCLEGQVIAGKVLLFPGGKGSSVVQMDGLYKLELNGAAPLGFIVREPDTVLVSTAIIMEIPMVDHVGDEFYSTVRTGDQIEIDASEELAAITLTEHND